MSKYSVELGELMFDPHAVEAIEKALSTYPLYQGKKEYDLIPSREELNGRILKHYKYHEIGCETVGMFLDRLEATMCEIMPYYNELFKSVEIMADIKDPFGNVNITETFEQTRDDILTRDFTSTNATSGTQTSSDNVSDTGDTLNAVKFSDTPQNDIENLNTHLTTYTEDKTTLNTNRQGEGTVDTETESSTTDKTTEGNSGTVSHTLHREGNHGVNTYAHDMIEFRNTIIDVTNQIVNDIRLHELFMMVY